MWLFRLLFDPDIEYCTVSLCKVETQNLERIVRNNFYFHVKWCNKIYEVSPVQKLNISGAMTPG